MTAAQPLTAEERTRRVTALTVAETTVSRSPSFARLVEGIKEREPEPEPAAEPVGHLPRVIRDGAPVDRWVQTEHGLQRWRPIVGHLVVTALPCGGRMVEMSGGRAIRLEQSLAAHLAWLLMPEEWRVLLEGRLGELGR